MGGHQHDHHKKGKSYNEQFIKYIITYDEETVYCNEEAPAQQLEQPILRYGFKIWNHLGKAIKSTRTELSIL